MAVWQHVGVLEPVRPWTSKSPLAFLRHRLHPRPCALPDLLQPLTLEVVGHYVLVAHLLDPDGHEAAAALSVGRSAAEWAESPLRELPPLWTRVAPVGGADFVVGGDAQLDVFNAFDGARLLLVWGNRLDTPKQTRQLLPPIGVSRHAIPLSDECVGGCQLVAVLSIRGASVA